MAVAFVAEAHASSAGSAVGRLAVNKPAGVATGQLLLAFIYVTRLADGVINMIAPTGWALYRQQDDGTNASLFIYTKRVASGDPASWTWAWDWIAGRTVCGCIAAYSGGRVTAHGSQANANGTTHAIPTITNNVNNAMHVTAVGGLQNVTWTPSSGYTERADFADTLSVNLTVADKIVATGALNGVAHTSSGSTTSASAAVLIAPDGITQPSGPGTTIFVYDDIYSESGAGFTVPQVGIAFPVDFKPLGYSPEIYYSLVDVQIMDGVGTAVTTFNAITALAPVIQFAATKTLKWASNVGAETNQYTNLGVAVAANTNDEGAVSNKCPIIITNAAAAFNPRGVAQIHGLLFRNHGTGNVQFTIPDTIAACIADSVFEIETGVIASTGTGDGLQRMVNTILRSNRTGSTLGLLANSSYRYMFGVRLVAGAAPGSFIAPGATFKHRGLRYAGAATAADFNIASGGVGGTSHVYVDHRWSSLPRFSNADLTSTPGPKEYALGAFQAVDPDTFLPVAGIPLKATDLQGNVIFDTTTDASGLITWGADQLIDAAYMLDYYLGNGSNGLAYDWIKHWPISLDVNKGVGANPNYPSKTITMPWPHRVTTYGPQLFALDMVILLDEATLPPPDPTDDVPYLEEPDIDTMLTAIGQDVSIGGVTTKGFIDRETVEVTDGQGTAVLGTVIKVTVHTGTLPALAVGVEIGVDGSTFIVHDYGQVGDGAMTEILCTTPGGN